MRPARFLLCVLMVLANALISDAAAQGPEEFDAGVAAGPLQLVADVHPGEVWEGSFRMAARATGTRSTFDLEIRDLAQGPTGHKQAVERGGGARSAAGWIDVASEVNLAPGERRDVLVTVSVPADAFGAYSGYIVVRLRSDEPTERLAAVVVPTIDIEVLVRVRSRGPLEVGVERIELEGAGAGEEPRLSVDIRNSGVWLTTIKGDVLLYPESGLFPHRVELPYRSDGQPYELYPGQEIRLNCARCPESLQAGAALLRGSSWGRDENREARWCLMWEAEFRPQVRRSAGWRSGPISGSMNRRRRLASLPEHKDPSRST